MIPARFKVLKWGSDCRTRMKEVIVAEIPCILFICLQIYLRKNYAQSLLFNDAIKSMKLNVGDRYGVSAGSYRLAQCKVLVYHKSHMDLTATEPVSPRFQIGV
jgi:hypothetical protein